MTQATKARRGLVSPAALLACALLLCQCDSGTRSSELSARKSTSPTLVAPPTSQPWEFWKDLTRLAEMPQGYQSLLRSSHCPTGCRYDRHSDGDWRYLSVEGEEGVIFEEVGAGAITRIWMTMGHGVSVPLSSNVRIRIYVDGNEEPVVDVPLPELFNGSTRPFVPPLVGHRLSSSGGNFSYVPIPYREGCRVTLVGAHQERIWFQFNFHRVEAPGEIETFNGHEDLSALSELLSLDGASPWPSSEPWVSAAADIEPGAGATLLERTGSGTLTGLWLKTAPRHLSALDLILTFDSEQRVRMPLRDFFAIGRGGKPRDPSFRSRSLFVGLDASGGLYSYFPMPFFESVEVSLLHRGTAAEAPAPVVYRIHGEPSAPSPSSGLFGATFNVSDGTPPGLDFRLLDLRGHGRWVGLFAELGSIGSRSRLYLEGDERVYIDGSEHPTLHGTGVEDFFNGGFYFDQGPISQALHGAPYVHRTAKRESLTAAYRMMPGEGITFGSRITAGLEGGVTGELSMRARTVAYYYQRSEPGLYRSDRLDLGDPSSRESHSYSVSGPSTLRSLDSRFEGQPPRALVSDGVYRPPGTASFVLQGSPEAKRYRLRRRFDAGVPGQTAEIRIDGVLVGRFPPIAVNSDRRWQEVGVDLRPVGTDSTLALEISALPTGDDGALFTAFAYELWSDAPPQPTGDVR